MSHSEFEQRQCFETNPQPNQMEKPKINVHLIISQGEMKMLEMNEGTGPDDRKDITDECSQLVRLRNFIDAELINLERKIQASFIKKPLPADGE